jgi:hypothetical protein
MTALRPRGVRPVPSAALIDGINVTAVAAAVQGCAGVSGLDSGLFGEVASYLPGRQVPGVVVRRQAVLIQVRARWGLQAGDLLDEITTAVTPIVQGRRVHIVIGDIDEPPALAGPAFGGPLAPYGRVRTILTPVPSSSLPDVSTE